MASEVTIVEERLKSFHDQLQTEFGILDRIVYKNKNQHRRCLYFQYLLKVRRDLRLLQSARLEEILNSAFLVISGNRPRQKVQLLESLKRRKCGETKYNFLDRLLGVARLLSQMVEPILKAATDISTLLGRAFFMGFSVTVLAILARLRVLVQQILLDVVSVFNLVSSLSQKEQSIKLNQEGFEVFREYYPKNEKAVFLECTWETDKFVLHEKIIESEISYQEKDIGEDVPVGASAIQYQCINVFLQDDEFGKTSSEQVSDGPGNSKADDTCSPANPDAKNSYGKPTSESSGVKVPCSNNNLPHNRASSIKEDDTSSLAASVAESHDWKPMEESTVAKESRRHEIDTPPPCPSSLKTKSLSGNKVAFVSVKGATRSTANDPRFHVKETENSEDKSDPFFSLLTCGNLTKNSLFS